MVKNQRKLTLLLLLACLVLAACGEKKTVHKIDWQTAPAYLSEDVALPVETCALNGSCTDGERIYYLTETRTEGARDFQLCRASLPEGTAEPLEQYQSPSMPEGSGYTFLGPVLGADGTLWLWEAWSVSHYDLPEDFDEEQETKGKYFTGQDLFYQVRQLDSATGRELAVVDFSAAVQELEKKQPYVSAAFAVDGKGRIYLADNSGVSVLDSRGQVLFTQEATLPYAGVMGSAGTSLALLPDGTVAALTVQSSGKREVRTLDPAAKGWGERRWETPGRVTQIYPGSGGFLFYYKDRDTLWAWEPEGLEGRELLELSAGRLDSGIMCFAPLEEGRLAALTMSYEDSSTAYIDEGRLRLRLLSPTDKLPDKIQLVYGTMGLGDGVVFRINQFNQRSEEYHIELRDYYEGGVPRQLSEEQKAAARKRLYADMAAGNGPDIWDQSLPLDQYARERAFEDLWPWIEGDPDLGREAVMEHVLDCASTDGALYTVCGSFVINTAYGLSSVVGDRNSWTLEELLAAYETLEPGASLFNGYVASGDLLQKLIAEDLDRYVDWEAGTCAFDTEEFKALLELCARLPREADFATSGGAPLRERRMLLWDTTMIDMNSFLSCEARCAGPEALTDYEAYLSENHVYGTLIDENGNWREKDAVTCDALSWLEYFRSSRDMSQNWAGAPTGTLEGGGYAAYVGFPTQGGAGSSFTLCDTLSMSAACRHTEGAWAYIRQSLLPGGSLRRDGAGVTDHSYSPGFPVNRADFEQDMAPQWLVNKSGEYVLDKDGQRIQEPKDVFSLPMEGQIVRDPLDGYIDQIRAAMVVIALAPTEPQMENFWKLYNAIDHVYTDSTWDLYQIIQEPAEAYFAGDKSLDEAAALIQSRAAIYVGEQQ